MILTGNARAVLPTIAAVSVDCCVTSPPYYGLRDYGVDGQIGLEPTPDAYVAALVEVFRHVRRVLRADGTLFLNLGDTYGAKQLLGIPWRVAFALQADGWYLRSDIIWAKPNPMPESVTDRPTKAHEYVFLLSKQERYYYDADAIREVIDVEYLKSRWGGSLERTEGLGDTITRSLPTGRAQTVGVNPKGANKRTVWTFATLPTPDAHFATYPIELPEICIRAGSRENGTVLDPFAGSGTTGLACVKTNRKFVGIELNPEYVTICERRLERHYSLFAD